jgi:hypothetical protein
MFQYFGAQTDLLAITSFALPPSSTEQHPERVMLDTIEGLSAPQQEAAQEPNFCGSLSATFILAGAAAPRWIKREGFSLCSPLGHDLPSHQNSPLVSDRNPNNQRQQRS